MKKLCGKGKGKRVTQWQNWSLLCFNWLWKRSDIQLILRETDWQFFYRWTVKTSVTQFPAAVSCKTMTLAKKEKTGQKKGISKRRDLRDCVISFFRLDRAFDYYSIKENVIMSYVLLKLISSYQNWALNSLGSSSNINEVIRVISCFFSEKSLHVQKSIKKPKKHKKHQKQTSDFHSDVFYTHKKHIKHKSIKR